MAVKAKFKVSSEQTFEYGGQKLFLNAVVPQIIDGQPEFENPEDESFWNATPSGSMEIQITNPAAAEQFQPGDSFYVTFEKAEPAVV